VTHGSQVVNFGWLDFGNDGDEIGSIAQITIMQIQLHSSFMSVAIDMIDTSGVETGRPTNDTMDLKVTNTERKGERNTVREKRESNGKSYSVLRKLLL
jgi:hypothetical protein